MRFLQILLTFAALVFLSSCNNGPSQKLQENNKQSSDDGQQIESRNKEIVIDFYQKVFGDKDVTAIDQYIDSIYIQHNPMLQDGKEALRQFVSTTLTNLPKTKVDIQRVAAEKDLVFIHTRSAFGGKTYSIVDIFRLSNSKIVEHWDVMQELPEKAANAHPLF